MTTDLSDGFENVADATVYGLFMYPVGRYTNKNHIEHKQIVLNYIESLAGDSAQLTESNPLISRNVLRLGPTNILDLTPFATIKSTIIDAVRKVNQEAYAYALPEQITLTDSYLELGSENAMYAPHEHSNVIYSGTYFINFDLTQHAVLKFRRNITTNYYPSLQLQHTEENAFNQLEAIVPYNEGDIVIHPPNIQHGYEASNHTNRITLSFNVAPF